MDNGDHISYDYEGSSYFSPNLYDHLESSLDRGGDFDSPEVFSTEAYPTFHSSPHKSLITDIPIENKIQSSSFFNVSKHITLEDLPSLLECTSPDATEELLLLKLKQCCTIFDFTNPTHDLRGKEKKRGVLNELIEHSLICPFNYLTEKTYPAIFNMVAENTFRTFPYDSDFIIDQDDDDTFYEASWPHLSLVYEYLKNVLESKFLDQSLACSFLSERYLYQVVELFNSKDNREREYVRNILHRIYSRFFPYRAYLRKCMSSVFLRHIYECESFNGISPLLDIYSSIIHGFALPLKAEHITFLMKVLLPLHKGHDLNLYHEQLQICVLHFLLKDDSLSKDIIAFIIKNWPRARSQHQILVLGEIESILSILRPETVSNCLSIISKLIAKLISDDHFQIAEKALQIAKSIMLTLSDCDVDKVENIVYPAILHTSEHYWNSHVSSLATEILELIRTRRFHTLEENDDGDGGTGLPT